MWLEIMHTNYDIELAMRQEDKELAYIMDLKRVRVKMY